MDGTIRKIVTDRDTGYRKGFGFIRGTDGQDYFFHRTALEQATVSFDDLREGAPVAFTPIDGEAGKGPRAIEVRVTA